MKYFIYIILLYIVLPFNFSIDFITALIFFIAFNEDSRFALIFAFVAGLLIDLYNPAHLGVNILVYIVLVQSLLYLKRYIIQNMFTIFATFLVFYLMKIVITHLIVLSPLDAQPIIITILIFLPFFAALNKLVYKVWMKT